MILKLMKLKSICFLLLLSIAAFAQEGKQQIVPNRKNDPSQVNKPYVIFISADGFRADFADKYGAENLIRLRNGGVQAQSMKPSFPSVTFSNHYTLATGMYPSHHGLVNNSYYDPNRREIYNKKNESVISDSTWYGGVPIWNLAEQHKMLSASFYWVGSETAINGIRPTYWYQYSTTIPMSVRLKAVKDWLALPEGVRPHLITFYLPEVDFAGHRYGPNSVEVGKAVKYVDSCVGKINEYAQQSNLDVNIVFVSDHGMTAVDNINTLPLPTLLKNEKYVVPSGDVLIHVYVNDKKDVKTTYKRLKAGAKGYDVLLTSKTPKRWHYRPKDNKDGRLGDILLVPKLPNVFNFSGGPTTIGKHGFDNDLPEMQATFYAWGPAFKTGLKIPSFENVNVYPLIAKILGLSYHHKIDGKAKVLTPILK